MAKSTAERSNSAFDRNLSMRHSLNSIPYGDNRVTNTTGRIDALTQEPVVKHGTPGFRLRLLHLLILSNLGPKAMRHPSSDSNAV